MEETLVHVCKEHQLGPILLDSAYQIDYNSFCYGCARVFRAGDATYGCIRSRCGFKELLHKECMEMPREIMHPIHPSHPLTLHYSKKIIESIKCAVCNVWGVYGLHYRCSASCDGLSIHMACMGIRNEKHPPMPHPGHPEHQLRFSKKTRWCPFPCDACGATEKGDSYTCTVCDYCIHESCALLPLSKDFPHHQHPLSLAFSPPYEYIQYDFDCAICSTTLPFGRWVYHCRLCRYVVHLNCATSIEKEREMEEETFVHVCHPHPLGRILPGSTHKIQYHSYCYGCWRNFRAGDATYGCSHRCGSRMLLHKECMEMPREIMHPIHPSHPLTLYMPEYSFETTKCAVCEEIVYGLRYRCSHGNCNGFSIHFGCTVGFLTDKQPQMVHPSHPHQLRFSKKTRSPCDACGSTEKGNSYICTLCDYCIHESCALLPLLKDLPRHHPHPLSLTFSLPSEYINNEFVCRICSTTLPLRHWVYHCHLCRYVIHLNCATSTFDNENESAIDGKEVTKFPIAIDDMYEKLIRPFVRRQICVRHYDHKNLSIGAKYNFSKHTHNLLTFTAFSASSSSSISSSHDHYEKNDGDEDDFDRWGLICDGCALPIREKKQTDDDDEDDECDNGYMSCDECKYFLHLSCFNLPPEIPSLSVHPLKDHNLTLRNVDGKLTDWIQCYICCSDANGLYYACTYRDCRFKIDIKCASLPNTIKYASHLRHNYLKLVTDYDYRFGVCANCYCPISERMEQYRCNSCRFSICGQCVMLPATNKHRQENHLLRLIYDACVNRPGDFYCSNCEGPMDPRSLMYHCRECDQSFHPKCFPATSGKSRNIKYGTEHKLSSIHNHPLRFQIITNKKRCDLCHGECYDEPGFQCASCFFVLCKFCCISHMDDAQKAIS